MKARLQRTLLLAALALTLVPALTLLSARYFLYIHGGSNRADVIIVLGGESELRAKQALSLYREGAAPQIIVTGNGDGIVIQAILEEGGVPARAIEWESHSRSTKENAEFTAQLLSKRGIRHAILVTSWFHSRRALSSFRHFAPEIQFSSLPAQPSTGATWETFQIYQEYVKTAWYFVRFGIAPWEGSLS